MGANLLGVCEESSYLQDLDRRGLDGFTLQLTSDVDEALELLEREQFDCVLCDVKGSSHGASAVEAVSTSYPDIPVISLCSDYCEVEVAESGATDCFLKGQPVELLKNRVEGYVEHRSTARVLEHLIENVPSGVLVVDDDGKVALANQAFIDLWGLGESPEDVVGVDDREAMEEAAARLKEPERWLEKTGERIEAGEEVGFDEIEFVDGRVVERMYVPVEEGGVERDLWVFRDVTRHRRRENQLAGLHEATRELIDADDRQTVYEVLVETAEDVLDYDTAGWYEPAEEDLLSPRVYNDEAEELFGEVPEIGSDSFFGEAFESGEILVEEDVSERESIYNPETPIRSEVAVPVGDYGVLVSGSRDVVSVDDRDLKFLEILAANAVAALHGLDQEREIERREEWYSALIRNSKDMITVVEPDGTIVYQSPSVREVLGYDPGEMKGEVTFDYVHPEDRERVRERFARGIAEGQGYTDSIEFRYRSADGDWIWLESIGTNLMDHPVVEGGVLNSRDVTERKRHEKELERQKKRLEEFASVVSHDLRNPLTVVEGRLELALETGDVEHAESARVAADRMDDLIDSLLHLARAGAVVSDPEEESVEDLAKRAWSTFPSGDADLEVGCSLDVDVDDDRVVQMFENLFRNSIEHGVEDDGDDLTVRVGELRDDAGFYVEDDGAGLSEDAREKAFEHGYTEGGGSGLGLAIVEDVAEAHGWRVEACESDDGGARFEFHVDPPSS